MRNSIDHSTINPLSIFTSSNPSRLRIISPHRSVDFTSSTKGIRQQQIHHPSIPTETPAYVLPPPLPSHSISSHVTSSLVVPSNLIGDALPKTACRHKQTQQQNPPYLPPWSSLGINWPARDSKRNPRSLSSLYNYLSPSPHLTSHHSHLSRLAPRSPDPNPIPSTDIPNSFFFLFIPLPSRCHAIPSLAERGLIKFKRTSRCLGMDVAVHTRLRCPSNYICPCT